ncbi:MAG: DUF4369 domain-containing protein [Prevotella sp.]|nr:DUF4369 domain-containing protein [Prevotella sp.]
MYKQLFIGLITVLALASCGVDGKHFRLEGRILNMNQGEFYVYNDEGMVIGIDTVKVNGGRFAYEMPCDRPTTLMLVFPNFSEQPIFAQPGKTVNVKGDASHLKELKVEGTGDNELMSKFREQIANASPPEIKKYARQFVEDHPESPVGVYLVKKYFIIANEPDYKEAARLVKTMTAKQSGNGPLNRMATLIKSYQNTAVNAKLPTFTYYDTKGSMVSSAELSSGLAIICTWASWNFDSMEQLRTLKRAQRKSGGRLKVVSISLDGSRYDCDQQLRRDTITWKNICDGDMFESKPIRQLGLMEIPDNIVIKNGRIVARGVSTQDLPRTIEQQL